MKTILALVLLLVSGATFAAEPKAISVYQLEAGYYVVVDGKVVAFPPSTPLVVDPPVVDPPPVTDLVKAFSGALAKVTEAGKVQTAANVKAIVDPALASALKGELTDLPGAKQNLPFLLSLPTIGKADWAEWNAVFKSQIEKSTTVAGLAAVLKAASDELAKVK